MSCTIIAPQAFMKQMPSKESETVSEVYFSEKVEVLQEQGKWARIKNHVDSYEGWVKKKALCTRESDYPSPCAITIAKVESVRVAHIYTIPDTVRGPHLSLGFDSRLEVIDATDPRWLKVVLPDGKQAFVQRGDVSLEKRLLTKEEMCEKSKKFIGLAYTWGGRSSYFGYDCSGFVQMLFRQMGVFLPRDSKDQVRWEGFRTISKEELQPGDLLFWGLNEDKIRHVGLYLGENSYIHATVRENNPTIHISKLSEAEAICVAKRLIPC